jgi:putative ABC transport system permease protein
VTGAGLAWFLFRRHPQPIMPLPVPLAADLRHAARALRRAPGFSLLAVTALALGIGASTATFSVVDGVLLQPLDYDRPQELVALWSEHPRQGPRLPPSYPDAVDWGREMRAFSGVAFARGESAVIRGPDGAYRAGIALVSEGFFRVLGARALVGRTFAPDEERPGAPRVAVLAHGFWQARFGGDPAVLGRTLDAVDGAYTIVGVLPPGIDWPGPWAEAYVALGPQASTIDALTRRDFRVDHRVVARLASGTSLARARAEMDVLSRSLAGTWPKDNAGWKGQVVPLRDEILGNVRGSLVALAGAVGLLLVVACVNVATLSLVRASARARESAVRVALGADASRLARASLAEAFVLSAAGLAGGFAFAWTALRVLRAAPLIGIPRLDEVALDPRAFAFAALATLAVTILVALAPALQSAAADPAAAMREGTLGGGSSRRSRRWRATLVVAELAVALVLLAGCGVLARSFARVRAIEPGVDVDRLAYLRLELESLAGRYDTPEKLLALQERVRERVAAIPGVRAAAIINHFPVLGAGVFTPLRTPGMRDEEQRGALYRLADEHYFATAGHRIVAGRAFLATDMTPSSRAIIVSEGLARTLWPGANPIGRPLRVFRQLSGRADYGTPVDAEVVGVAADVKGRDLTQPPLDAVYLPQPVNPWRNAYVLLRADGDPASLVPALRRAVAAVDADLPLASAMTLSRQLADVRSQRRLFLAMVTLFAGSALLLGALGVGGVVAFGVSQRRRELGVRAALGASPARLQRLVLREGLLLAAGGVALGLAGALAASRVLASLVFGVGPRDAATLVSVGALLALVTVAATWLPARRAARADPLGALRSAG